MSLDSIADSEKQKIEDIVSLGYSKEEVIKNFKNPHKLNIFSLALNGSRKLALELSINEDLKLKAFSNINRSDATITKKYELKNLVESGNFGYVKNNFNYKFNILTMYKELISNVEKCSNYTEINILKEQTLKNLKNKIENLNIKSNEQ